MTHYCWWPTGYIAHSRRIKSTSCALWCCMKCCNLLSLKELILCTVKNLFLFSLARFELCCVSKKVPTFKLSVTLSSLNQFSECCTAEKRTQFATKPIRQYPPHLRNVATLLWEIRKSNCLQIFSTYGKMQTNCILCLLTLLNIQNFWYFWCLR